MDNFYKHAQPFFDSGYIQEIYSSDKLSICNVTDSAYYVFPKDSFTEKDKYPIGYALSRKLMERIINDNDVVYYILGKLGKEHAKYHACLCPEVLEKMKAVKEQQSVTGIIGKDINYDWEEKIKQRIKGL